jgi:hypothetical protein
MEQRKNGNGKNDAINIEQRLIKSGYISHEKRQESYAYSKTG